MRLRCPFLRPFSPAGWVMAHSGVNRVLAHRSMGEHLLQKQMHLQEVSISWRRFSPHGSVRVWL